MSALSPHNVHIHRPNTEDTCTVGADAYHMEMYRAFRLGLESDDDSESALLTIRFAGICFFFVSGGFSSFLLFEASEDEDDELTFFFNTNWKSNDHLKFVYREMESYSMPFAALERHCNLLSFDLFSSASHRVTELLGEIRGTLPGDRGYPASKNIECHTILPRPRFEFTASALVTSFSVSDDDEDAAFLTIGFNDGGVAFLIVL
uniref:Uncharacterized protein n=1 Tax=Romanomermis culicivorax TaxID=13658 RepID=A0A915IKI8_ROMCU